MAFSEKAIKQTENWVSSGVVLYSIKDNQPLFLIMAKNHLSYAEQKPWALNLDIGPLGNVKSGENLYDAAFRITYEKTGLKLDTGRLDSDFADTYKESFFYTRDHGFNEGKMLMILKKRVYFLASVTRDELRPSLYHADCDLMPLDMALQKFWRNEAQQKELLIKAADHIAIRRRLLRE